MSASDCFSFDVVTTTTTAGVGNCDNNLGFVRNTQFLSLIAF